MIKNKRKRSLSRLNSRSNSRPNSRSNSRSKSKIDMSQSKTRKQQKSRRRSKKKKARRNTKKKVEYIKIVPTEDESVFESYLTVLVEILGERKIYKSIIGDIEVIPIPNTKCRSPWTHGSLPENIKQFIFFCGNVDSEGNIDVSETHYKSCKKITKEGRDGRNSEQWVIVDPYHVYQISGSHGFCQMFAYFITKGDIDGFRDVSEEKDKGEKRNIFTHNTFQCLQKVLKLLKENTSIVEEMRTLFENEIKYDYERNFGIGKDMTFDHFIDDLTQFKENDLYDYIDYWMKK